MIKIKNYNRKMRAYKRKTRKTTHNNEISQKEADRHHTTSNTSKSNCNNSHIKRSYGTRNNLASMIRSWWWIYCCCYICLLSPSGNNNVVNGAYSSDTDDLINELDRPSK